MSIRLINQLFLFIEMMHNNLIAIRNSTNDKTVKLEWDHIITRPKFM